jgi:hypothetical protein
MHSIQLSVFSTWLRKDRSLENPPKGGLSFL